jgi:hypothetical protein
MSNEWYLPSQYCQAPRLTPRCFMHYTRNANWRNQHNLKQLKQNDDCPSQAVQPSVRVWPKIRAGGLPPTEKCALESVVNCQYSETLGASHHYWGSCAHLVLQHGISSRKVCNSSSRRIRYSQEKSVNSQEKITS